LSDAFRDAERCRAGQEKPEDNQRPAPKVVHKHLAESVIGVPGPDLPQHLPNQFRGLFALAKRWRFYTLLVVRGLSKGGAAWSPSLKVNFRTAFRLVFFQKHAFGIQATDATGRSGTADDAAL
jgi:hypothetical protein